MLQNIQRISSILIIASLFHTNKVADGQIIQGVGYREPDLQVPKTAYFISEEPKGIDVASFAGGTNIFIKSYNLNQDTQNNIVMLYSNDQMIDLQAPLLSEVDTFQSQPMLGFLTYRLPSVSTLFGVPDNQLINYQNMSFQIWVKTFDSNGNLKQIKCGADSSRCLITYFRQYTPALYYLQPPVNYYGQLVNIIFDPKSTSQKININLPQESLPFTNFKIGNYLIDFDGYVNESFQFTPHFKYNQIQGMIGQIPPNKSQPISFLWANGYAQIQNQQATFCSVDNSTCYMSKIVPVIFGVSSNQGYTTGGLVLTINGFGFDYGNVSVLIDGQVCQIINVTSIQINCQLGKSPSVSQGSLFLGSNGIRRTIYYGNDTNPADFNYIQNIQQNQNRFTKVESLQMQLQIPYNFSKQHGTIFKGWFVPPITARYRFYLYCNNACQLNLTQNGTSQQMVSIQNAVENGDYWHSNGTDKMSQWVSLSQGQNYFLETLHSSYTQSYFSAAVEIEQSQTEGNIQSMKEIQQLQINFQNNFETVNITINNPDNGTYKLLFLNPYTLVYSTSSPIQATASADQLKNATQNYYLQTFNSEINCYLTMLDSNMNVTTNTSNATQYQYSIVMKKLIKGNSSSNVIVYKMTTLSQIQVQQTQKSSSPLQGSFIIQCTDQQGNVFTTRNINVMDNNNIITQRINQGCPFLSQNVFVSDTNYSCLNNNCQNLYVNGRSINVRFLGINGSPGQLQIQNSSTDPLIGNNISFSASTLVSYNSNLFYDPIPFEMLKTFETSPQVMVSVGDLPAVCHNLSCNFTYIQPVGQIQSFNYDLNSSQLTLNGTNLTASGNLVQSIIFAQSKCTIDYQSSFSQKQIKCKLSQTPACGTWIPTLISNNGIVPGVKNLSPVTIQCSATSVYPSTSLNVYGGDLLTFFGQYFPIGIQQSQFLIYFNDSLNTLCNVVSSNNGSFSCITNQFNQSSLGQTFQVQITINGVTVQNSLVVTLNNYSFGVVNITPSQISPLYRQKLVFQLDSSFNQTLVYSDFQVNVSNSQNLSIPIINIVGANDSQKTFTIAVNVTPSAKYNLTIKHRQYGYLNMNGFQLNIGSSITNISAQNGSIYGGTLLTISGMNFGNQTTDSTVQIQLADQSQNITCYTQSLNQSQIVCRIDNTINLTDGQIGNVVVTLRNQDQAQCLMNTSCQFNFTASVPSITNMTVQFNYSQAAYTIIVNGNNFTGDNTSVILTIENYTQITQNVNSTQATFLLQNASCSYGQLQQMNLYFPIGIPSNNSIITANYSIQPQILYVEPNNGSFAGTVLYVNASGVGTGSNVSLTDSNGNSICQYVNVTSYGNIHCQTLQQNITNQTIVIVANGTSYNNCLNINTSYCYYQQLSTDPYPFINSTYIYNNKLYLYGDNFYNQSYIMNYSAGSNSTNSSDQNSSNSSSNSSDSNSSNSSDSNSSNSSDSNSSSSSDSNSSNSSNSNSSNQNYTYNTIYQTYYANVTLAGLNADYVEIISQNQMVAYWNYGILPYNNYLVPQVNFIDYSSGAVVYPQVQAISNVTNSLNITNSSQGIECSFAGGCIYNISSWGLAQLLRVNQSQNNITVCQNLCVYNHQISNASTAYCTLHPMSTIYSASQFNISKFKQINSNIYFGTGSSFSQAFDGLVTTQNLDISSKCSVGMQFRQGYIAILSQVKFFLSLSDISIFKNGNLVFQGSNDGISYTNIFTVDNNVHGGWNYFTFNQSNQPQYQYFQFFGKQPGTCIINEIIFTGIEVANDNNPTYNCTPILFINGVKQQQLNQVTFNGSITPLLTQISPIYGNVQGGDTITFNGTGFSSSIQDYTITIDGINCQAISANSTYVQCITGPRMGLGNSSLSIFIANIGNVSIQDLKFYYVSSWSNESTWAGRLWPFQGDSIDVPIGLNLLVDQDYTPLLNQVQVEGSLIFVPNSDPNHQSSFKARQIFVNGGQMQVGTEQNPYTSKLNITLYGRQEDPQLPIYGNKCIALRNATLDLHGVQRNPAWTFLYASAFQSDNKIIIIQAVDWQIGEQIVIASTVYDMNQAETFFIKNIDRSNNYPIIYLDHPMQFTHYAATETYGGVAINTRAEVGLLTRNVVFRGDPETSQKYQYGATILMHSLGDDSVVARISNVELTNVGQAKQGRYPINFYMIGNASKSYITGTSIHDSNNRAISIHGSNQLNISGNVIYNIKGHSVFMEDAIESRNLIQNNLVINSIKAYNLLNSDLTPAGFWITHPDNDLIGNIVAGSDKYGFWYDLKNHSIGQAASTDVCPTRINVGQFMNNSAHSCGRYGLRIFPEMNPFQYPCQPTVYDQNYLQVGQNNPYWQNLPIQTNFYNLTSWKNLMNGAIGERMGYVRWNNFKVADNLLVGLEFSKTNLVSDGMAKIYNAVIVGHTKNSELLLYQLDSQTYTKGLVTPQSENFTVDTVQFFNYDLVNSAAIGGCSHCNILSSTDQGARTVTFQNIYFDINSVVQKIKSVYPHNDIFYDLDGTLTGKGPQSFYTYGYPHNQQPECDYLPKIYDGVVCNNSVQVRRLFFNNPRPSIPFQNVSLNILKWDQSLLNTINDINQYITSVGNYSIIPFRSIPSEKEGWTVPIVTGHSYKIHWGNQALDFHKMEIDQSERWNQADQNILLYTNFSQNTAIINVTVNQMQMYYNDSLTSQNPLDQRIQDGVNVVYNNPSSFQNYPSSIQQLFISAITGQQMNGGEKIVTWISQYCQGLWPCPPQTPQLGVLRHWSDVSNWINGTLPVQGSDVIIYPTWNMIIDVNTPILNKLTILGRLTFSNSTDVMLQAKQIIVNGGELLIGSANQPYQNNGQIILCGGINDSLLVLNNSVDAGNKILVNLGTIKMFGKQRTKNLMRLQQPAFYGSNTFQVESGLDLVQGDRLGLLPTSYSYLAFDDVFVQSYNPSTGIVQINSTLSHYHWGQSATTASKYNGVDIRGEVVLLTRNIQIIGQNQDGQGGQILTTSALDSNLNALKGLTIMDNVEIYNCSQAQTSKAALRFEGNSSTYSSITNSAIHSGLGWGIQISTSQNIYISNIIVFNFVQMGINLQTVQNITIQNSIISSVSEMIMDPNVAFNSSTAIQKRGGLVSCGYLWPNDNCSLIKINNNIVAGVPYAGYIVTAQDCDDSAQDKFFNNIAHSISDSVSGGTGALIYKNQSSSKQNSCYQASSFVAYKNNQTGIFSYDFTHQIIFSNMTLIDNVYSLGSYAADDSNQSDVVIQFQDNNIYGESEIPDCPDSTTSDYCIVTNKAGILPSAVLNISNDIMQTNLTKLPYYAIWTDPSGTGRVIFYRNKFFNFKNQTLMGRKQTVIGYNNYSSDYQPVHEFYDTQFHDVDDSAVANLIPPSQYWTNSSQCGSFPCTGPLNLLFGFKGTQFYGKQMNSSSRNFQVISNNQGFSPFIQNCQFKQEWNGYFCTENNISLLLFESFDQNRFNVSLQPINVSNSIGVNNVLNSVMHHNQYGANTSTNTILNNSSLNSTFNSSQNSSLNYSQNSLLRRLPLYPALVDAQPGNIYTVSYNSSIPKKQLFQLKSMNYNAGVTIRIFYNSSTSIGVFKDNVLIQQNQWNEQLLEQSQIQQSYCGENRFVGTVNALEFYITPNCSLYIQQIDTIKSMIRLKWTLDSFIQNGGTKTFSNKLCQAIGIKNSQMNFISIQEGSVIVYYNLIADQTNKSQPIQLISQLQVNAFINGVNLSAPILDMQQTLVIANSSNQSQQSVQTIYYNGTKTAVQVSAQSQQQQQQQQQQQSQSQININIIIIPIIVVVGVIIIIVIIVFARRLRQQSLQKISDSSQSENQLPEQNQMVSMVSVYDGTDMHKQYDTQDRIENDYVSDKGKVQYYPKKLR